MFIGISQNSFQASFASNDDCKAYLFKLKWSNGYNCKQCGNPNAIRGRTNFHKRCSLCKYDESSTAHTLFHKIKIPLNKAFGILFKISVRKKGMSTVEISKEFGINQKTAWLLKRKSQEGIKSLIQPKKNKTILKKHKSSPSINSQSNKKKDIFNSRSWERAKNTHIKRALKKISPQTRKSNMLIINSLSWLRGIHHICSIKFLHDYVFEYLYRHYIRKEVENALHFLIRSMVRCRPYMYRSKAFYVDKHFN